jgi:hypothetical protein
MDQLIATPFRAGPFMSIRATVGDYDVKMFPPEI